MKIIHCIFSFNIGGAETMLCDIIRLQAQANEVSLIIVNNDYDQALIKRLPENVKIYLLKRNPGSRVPTFIFRLNMLLRKLKPDVINLHSSLLPRIIWGQKDKLWYTVHDVNITMRYSPKLHGVIAISESVRDNIKDDCNCQIKVIPNGIDAEAIKRKEIYKQTESFKIVQVARLLCEKKGQDLLIEALALLKNKGIEDINVDFIGDGPDEGFLKRLAVKRGVADKIRFLGLKDRYYIYSHLKDYDMMCHPSRYEGFGLVVAEGMAAGLPVLVSDCDGPMEVIAKGKYGLSFMSGDVDVLADKILEIKNHYDKYVSLAQAAYNHVKANYSIDRMVNDYLAAYEQ